MGDSLLLRVSGILLRVLGDFVRGLGNSLKVFFWNSVKGLGDSDEDMEVEAVGSFLLDWWGFRL